MDFVASSMHLKRRTAGTGSRTTMAMRFLVPRFLGLHDADRCDGWKTGSDNRRRGVGVVWRGLRQSQPA